MENGPYRCGIFDCNDDGRFTVERQGGVLVNRTRCCRKHMDEAIFRIGGADLEYPVVVSRT